MDKMSFASVYRTAAILAAFSRGDAPTDVAPCREEPTTVLVCPGLSIRERTAVGRALRTCWARACWWRSGATQRAWWETTDTHPTGWWVLQRPTIVPRHQGSAGSPLVSHFAFSEEADLHRAEPGL